MSKAALDFLLRLTDWFHGHWEDPEWGQHSTTQILIALAIRDLATGLRDSDVRGQVQGLVDKVIAKNAQIAAKG